MEYGMGSV
jgi:hypothetical protein